MSLEAAIAENTKALTALAAVLGQNNARLDQVVAGQQAALAKIDAKAGAPAADKKAETKKAETKKADAAPPKTETKAPETKTASFVPDDITDDMLRAHGAEYLGKADPADTGRAARGANLKALMQEFGVETLVGETGIGDADERKRAWWYIARWKAGKTVDFKATVDIATDPAADDAPAADEFGLG